MTLSFFVPGKAATAGSKRGFALKRNGAYTGQVLMTPANPRERDWKNSVATAAFAEKEKLKLDRLILGPVRLDITFIMERPKYHYRGNGSLKANAPELHVCSPDLTKLLRCAEDALTSVVWSDDSQVATTVVRKRYGTIPGAYVVICEDIENNAKNPEPVTKALQPSLAL